MVRIWILLTGIWPVVIINQRSLRPAICTALKQDLSDSMRMIRREPIRSLTRILMVSRSRSTVILTITMVRHHRCLPTIYWMLRLTAGVRNSTRSVCLKGSSVIPTMWMPLHWIWMWSVVWIPNIHPMKQPVKKISITVQWPIFPGTRCDHSRPMEILPHAI